MVKPILGKHPPSAICRVGNRKPSRGMLVRRCSPYPRVEVEPRPEAGVMRTERREWMGENLRGRAYGAW